MKELVVADSEMSKACQCTCHITTICLVSTVPVFCDSFASFHQSKCLCSSKYICSVTLISIIYNDIFAECTKFWILSVFIIYWISCVLLVTSLI